jgi:hypothetical protein
VALWSAGLGATETWEAGMRATTKQSRPFCRAGPRR